MIPWDKYFFRQESQGDTKNDSTRTIMTTTTTPTKKKIEPILILWWSTFFGRHVACDEVPTVCDNAIIKHCRTPCKITTNRSRVANSSVMIIHARDPIPLPPAQYSHIPLVLFTWENPVYTPSLSDSNFLSKFTYLMSYRPDLADFFLPTFVKPSLEPKPMPFGNKTGLIAAAFSHCETVRTAYLKELMKHIQVDSYGACLRNKKGLQERYSGDFKAAKEDTTAKI